MFLRIFAKVRLRVRILYGRFAKFGKSRLYFSNGMEYDPEYLCTLTSNPKRNLHPYAPTGATWAPIANSRNSGDSSAKMS